ncbi:MAG: hypothetical protein AB9836_04420 [Aminipila sp.]
MSDYYEELNWVDRQDGHDTVKAEDMNLVAHEAKKLGKEKLNKTGDGKDITVSFDETMEVYPEFTSGGKLSLILSTVKKCIKDLKLLKANTDSPTFTGLPKAPTQELNDNSTLIATTSFVKNNIVNNLEGTSGNKALSDAMGKKLNDEKAPINSPNFAGTVKLPAETTIGAVSNTEISYLKGLRGGIQAQLDNIPKYKYLDGINITIHDSSTQEQINNAAIAALQSSYATAVEWNAVSVEILFQPSDLKTDAEYYYNGSIWIFLRYISTAINRANGTVAGIVEDSEDVSYNDGQATISNEGLAKKAPAFTEALSRININTGDSITIILGKIKKFFNDLKTVAFTGDYNDLINRPSNLPANGGNSDTADKLKTARKIQIDGNVSGNAIFDGTADININVTVRDNSHKHIIKNITDFPQIPSNSDFNLTGLGDIFVANIKSGQLLSWNGTKWVNVDGQSFTQLQADWNKNDSASVQYIQNKPTALPANGGNSDTADKLKTARKINGVPFDGSSDITIETGGNKYKMCFTISTWSGLSAPFSISIAESVHKCGIDINALVFILEGDKYVKTVGYPGTGYKVSIDSTGNVIITTSVKFPGKVIVS